MKFVLIFGPQAVGKMTVGHELEKITALKLFHNHMTIELLHPYFGFSAETWRLVDLFRVEILEAVSKSDLDGMIFTYVWAFDLQSDWDFVHKICMIFESKGADVYFVELEASLEERVMRNTTPHRLEHKPTKRNVEHSEQDLRASMEKYRLNSIEGEIKQENYVRINNEGLSPQDVASMIKEKFHL
ncbi:shikimate kinase [Paenibacillus pectinilyticus]|uniref:Shikimate kinase n=1 Tax=Paenibacillus pectinilyticus TaxID=512399 RepID=A0A1C0ZZY0_9BACL|nr:AAA family ATPase [Paenibacillus pectinilyticus]OCT13693.1 shikimate kinase [Paenibacillus pectinilyticus]